MAQRHAHKLWVRAPWQGLCVPWDLGSMKKAQQLQFGCTPIDPRCPAFRHPLPQNGASLLRRAGAPLLWMGPDLTHMIWPWATLSPMSRNLVQSLRCLPSNNSYMRRNETQARCCCCIQAAELVPQSRVPSHGNAPATSPSLETSAWERPRIAHS